MANPNIVNVTSIKGKTATLDVPTTPTVLVENPTSSNSVLKINSLVVANIDGTNSADLSVEVYRSSTAYFISKDVTIPADASLVVISKDTSIYLEEGDAIRVTANNAGDLQAVCSYEEIS